MKLGIRLRELRKASGFTLRDLAQKAGVDFTYLSKIETGKLEYMPAVDTIRRLAELHAPGHARHAGRPARRDRHRSGHWPAGFLRPGAGAA